MDISAPTCYGGCSPMVPPCGSCCARTATIPASTASESNAYSAICLIADTDVAARAGHVLDDDRLPERGPHALAEEARDRVGRPAGRIRHDHRDRTRGIGLGRRDPRHDRERGSARCQMEKLSAGKFHCTLPESFCGIVYQHLALLRPGASLAQWPLRHRAAEPGGH
jgi:hypothetical protein